MNPLKGLIRKFISPASGSLISQWLSPRVYNRTDLLELFVGYVHAGITSITEMFSSAEFYIDQVDRRTGDSTDVPNHPFINLLSNPNATDSKFNFLEGIETDYKMFGEYFIVITRGENTSLPLELDRIHPINMNEQVDQETGELVGWKYRGYSGMEIPLQLDEVIHVKRYNPRNKYRGWGALQASLNYVLTEKYGTQFTASFLENNAIPGGVFTIKKDMTKEAFEKLEAHFRQKYQGTDNAGKVLLIKNSEADFKKLGSTLADVGLKDLKVITSETILNMFKVPKQELGIPDNINLATSRELARGFARRVQYDLTAFVDGLQPLMDEYSAMANKVRKNKIDYKLCYRTIVPDDMELKSKLIESGLKNGYLTVNEARELMPFPLDPIQGGDTAYILNNMVPLGDPIRQKKPKPHKLVVKATKRKAKVKDRILTKEITYRQFNKYRREKWQAMKPFVEKTDKALSDFYQRQYETILRSGQYSLDLTQEAKRFKGTLSPILNELASVQYGVAQTLPNKAVKQPSNVSDYVDSRLDKFAESSLGGISDRLKKLLQQASEEKWSAEETASQLKKLYSDATDAKLLTIARTELNAISNYSASLAYKDMGYEYKVWFANPDACDFCAELDGKTVGGDDPFVGDGGTVSAGGNDYSADFGDVGEPPLHPNCQCDLVPSAMPASPFDFPAFDKRDDVAALAG